MEPGVHLTHLGEGNGGSKVSNSGATENSAATAQKTTSIRVHGVNRTVSSQVLKGDAFRRIQCGEHPVLKAIVHSAGHREGPSTSKVDLD